MDEGEIGGIMPKFKVGDTVWIAKCGIESVRKICPTCFGKKEVTLILGNGDSVILPCKGCGPGYDPPGGYISEYEYVTEPDSAVISGMTIEINHGEENVRYHGLQRVYDEKDIWATKEEAQIVAEEKKAQLDKDQVTRAEHIKKDVQKSFSWNAHYHMRHAKKDRESAEYHDKMAVLCKARAK